MAYILIAEDEENIRTPLAALLKKDGHEVCEAVDGADALKKFAATRPDLLLLDVMMPNKSGWDVCEVVRRQDVKVPILFLTARTSESDKVQGLNLGADDYITKPFGMRELRARVASALRRAMVGGGELHGGGDNGMPFLFGKVHVDPKTFTMKGPGVKSRFTPRELGLMRMLSTHAGEVMSRERLLNELWGIEFVGGTRTLDQHIAQLRKKLGREGVRIRTVHGVGYVYDGIERK